MTQSKEKKRPPIPSEILATPIVEDDGITHINIYVKGATKLGCDLAHFSHMPFVHPAHGTFNTIEGFWHWFKSDERSDSLRYLNGPSARRLGQKLTRRYQDRFEEVIMEANFCKIDQNPELKAEFLRSSLPFDHYYLHEHRDGSLPIRPAASQWLCRDFEKIRTMMQNGERPSSFPPLEVKSGA